LAAQRELEPELPGQHSGGHGLHTDQPCGCQESGVSKVSIALFILYRDMLEEKLSQSYIF